MPGSSPDMTAENDVTALPFIASSLHTCMITPVLNGAGAPETRFRPSLDIEGARNAGRIVRPQPRAQLEKAHERSHHGRRTLVRRSARSGLPACFVLSPAAIDTLGFVTVGI